MTPESGSSGGWAALAGRLRTAVLQAERCARGAPLGSAEGLIAGLREIGVCLEEAEQLFRGGDREGNDLFREELERWAAAMPALQPWMDSSAALIAGWAAAAGIGASYSACEPTAAEVRPGAVNEAG